MELLSLDNIEIMGSNIESSLVQTRVYEEKEVIELCRKAFRSGEKSQSKYLNNNSNFVTEKEWINQHFKYNMKYYCNNCKKYFDIPKLIADNEDYEHCPHCESDNFKFNK